LEENADFRQAMRSALAEFPNFGGSVSDRFYTPEPLDLGEFILDGSEAHHLAHVRRFKTGDSVTLFNGDGRDYVAEIADVAKKHVQLLIVRVEAPNRELGFPLHIASALPKGDRGDFLIEKLTELGVTDFTPLVTARSVVQPKDAKTDKLRRAVIEASKQCGRNVLLRVHPPCSLESWCALPSLPPTRWIAHPDGEPLAAAGATTGIAAAIGPEGGFTDDEVLAASQMGFCKVSLGPRILRVETAAMALAAALGMQEK
jgi:16S rRNA (uracil1498-N3)-methyltransferase